MSARVSAAPPISRRRPSAPPCARESGASPRPRPSRRCWHRARAGKPPPTPRRPTPARCSGASPSTSRTPRVGPMVQQYPHYRDRVPPRRRVQGRDALRGRRADVGPARREHDVASATSASAPPSSKTVTASHALATAATCSGVTPFRRSKRTRPGRSRSACSAGPGRGGPGRPAAARPAEPQPARRRQYNPLLPVPVTAHPVMMAVWTY